MHSNSENKTALYLLISVTVAFIVGRLFGGQLFDNNWSFIHWQHQPGWYNVVWLGLLVALTLLITIFLDKIAKLFASRIALIAAVVGLFLLLILFRFDSFIYGAGNMRVAQISQMPVIIFRWYEFGSIALVSGLYWFFNLFDLHPHALTASNTAAVYGWLVFSFACTLASLIGCVKLTGELATDAVRRFCLFVILFFGPQFVLYFGFLGVEPVVVAVTIWFALLSVRLNNRFTSNRFLALWLITATGISLHFSLVYLLPAAIYLSVRHLTKKNNQAARSSIWPLAAGLIGWAMLMIAVYYWGNRSFEFSRYLLFLHGKSPFGDYGLFSARHLSDVLQVFFLAAPTIIVTKYLWTHRIKSLLTNTNQVTASLMALAGNTAIVVLDPVSGIVFDFPRLVAFLSPLSFLMAVMLVDVNVDVKKGRLLLGYLAVISILIPLSYLPTCLRIDIAETYTTDYLNKHEFYCRNGCLAFRDAYFYIRDTEKETLDKANSWEWALPTMAPDYLCFRGANDLATSGDVREAIGVLYHMKAQNPYWSEIRTLLADLLMREGRYAQAKVEIDTTLMLEPYRKEHHMNLYVYHRDTKDYFKAIKAVDRAEELFPGDLEILTDRMIINFRAGEYDTADSLAVFLLETDLSLPYPYLILGFMEDARKDIRAAAHYYERFITLAPDQSETPRIQTRLQELETLLKEQ